MSNNSEKMKRILRNSKPHDYSVSPYLRELLRPVREITITKTDATGGTVVVTDTSAARELTPLSSAETDTRRPPQYFLGDIDDPPREVRSSRPLHRKTYVDDLKARIAKLEAERDYINNTTADIGPAFDGVKLGDLVALALELGRAQGKLP